MTHQANVWLDGEPIGAHYGGFTPFSFLVLAPQAGMHELMCAWTILMTADPRFHPTGWIGSAMAGSHARSGLRCCRERPMSTRCG